MSLAELMVPPVTAALMLLGTAPGRESRAGRS
jgi:hypothetical protein